MKNLLFIAVLTAFMGVNNSISHADVIKTGITFKQVSTRSSGVRDTIVTKYFYEDSKSNKYPIIINKKSGACYIWKKSGKTGKMYRQYMSSEISSEVSKEYGINYVPKKK